MSDPVFIMAGKHGMFAKGKHGLFAYTKPLNLECEIYKRQAAWGVTEPWDEDSPTATNRFIDIWNDYPYTLNQLKAYVNYLSGTSTVQKRSDETKSSYWSFVQPGAVWGGHNFVRYDGMALPAYWDIEEEDPLDHDPPLYTHTSNIHDVPQLSNTYANSAEDRDELMELVLAMTTTFSDMECSFSGKIYRGATDGDIGDGYETLAEAQSSALGSYEEYNEIVKHTELKLGNVICDGEYSGGPGTTSRQNDLWRASLHSFYGRVLAEPPNNLPMGKKGDFYWRLFRDGIWGQSGDSPLPPGIGQFMAAASQRWNYENFGSHSPNIYIINSTVPEHSVYRSRYVYFRNWTKISANIVGKNSDNVYSDIIGEEEIPLPWATNFSPGEDPRASALGFSNLNRRAFITWNFNFDLKDRLNNLGE